VASQGTAHGRFPCGDSREGESYILALAIAPQNPKILYAASAGYNGAATAWKSNDGGETWRLLIQTPIH
jgi:hypothetical protein